MGVSVALSGSAMITASGCGTDKPAAKPTPSVSVSPTGVAAVALNTKVTVKRTVLGELVEAEVAVSKVPGTVPTAAAGGISPVFGRWVSYRVDVAGKAGKYKIDPDQGFHLLAKDGREYQAHGYPVVTPKLKRADVGAGESTWGYITFDAPHGVETGGVITLQYYLDGGEAARWSL